MVGTISSGLGSAGESLYEILGGESQVRNMGLSKLTFYLVVCLYTLMILTRLC